MSDEGAASDLLDERPDLRGALETVLAVDEGTETWTFDDVAVESGPFGELVSRGIVERQGDEYRLGDPAAVRAALGVDGAEPGTDGATAVRDVPSVSVPEVDRTTASIVAGALAVVALVRVHVFQSVYRDGRVVLSGNDPYYYRYWVDRTVTAGSGPFDFGALAVFADRLPDGEPLMVAVLWWFAELVGGGVDAAGHVLAWYPVVSAVVTAAFVYLIAVKTTGDKRVGLAAVLVLAIIPGHALRTSLGYADHHAFDYVWLSATALALVSLVPADASDLRRPEVLGTAGALGLAVAGQVLAWEAGPVLILPVGVVVVASALTDVDAGRSPLRSQLPILGGLVVAAALTGVVHAFVGWHQTAIALTPALLFLGAVGAVVAAEAVRRTTEDVRHLLAVYAAGIVVGPLLVRVGVPAVWDLLRSELQVLFGSSEIAETMSLFSAESYGFIFLLGFTLVLALPAMILGLRRALEDDRWLVATAYAWYFLGLAAIQVRFVGEFASFASVFAGVGLVWAAAWIDAVPPLDAPAERLRIPDRSTLLTLVMLFLLVGSLGIVQVPIKTSQITIEDGTYHSAQFMANRSAAYDENASESYVFSQWGRNRVYNYFVNGESRSYGFAKVNYGQFVSSTVPDALYSQMLKGRNGYVVLSTDRSADDPRRTYARLVTAKGSRNGSVPGVGHYRALYLPPDESKIVFSVVPGARLIGSAPANATVSLATDVSIPRAQFTYERRVTANASGTYRVLLAQPGTYRVTVDGETRTVTVPESAVRNGTRVTV